MFTDQQWLEVRRKVELELRQRFPNLRGEKLDDVLGEVIVDLIGYWSRLSSSQPSEESPKRSFSYAVRRGTWMGIAEVLRLYEQHNHEVPRSGMLRPEVDEGGPWDEYYIWEWEGLHDPSPAPDVLVEELDEIERARLVLADMDSDELHDFFEHIATDETERDQAAREGVSRNAVHERRTVRRKRLKERATRYGLAA